MNISRNKRTESEKNQQNLKNKERMRYSRTKRTKKEKAVQNDKDKRRKLNNATKKSNFKTARERILKFRNSVRYGPIFPCVCCEQLMFEKGVKELDDKTQQYIKLICDKYDKFLFEKVFQNKLRQEIYKVSFQKCCFICQTCNKYLMKGKLPPMSAASNLAFQRILY